MKKTIYAITIIAVILTVAAGLIYGVWNNDTALTFAITFGTIAYHFIMRLAVGLIFNQCMRNKADYTKPWYQLRPWEARLYRLLKVKRWKDRLPTFQPDLFNPKLHSWDEIAQTMCQSELVHEVIAVLSFAPIIATVWFGAATVFVITSVCAAMIDLMFVIMQRYNRPRIVQLVKLLDKRNR